MFCLSTYFKNSELILSLSVYITMALLASLKAVRNSLEYVSTFCSKRDRLTNIGSKKASMCSWMKSNCPVSSLCLDESYELVIVVV